MKIAIFPLLALAAVSPLAVHSGTTEQLRGSSNIETLEKGPNEESDNLYNDAFDPDEELTQEERQGRRNLISIKDSCRNSHGGGNERHDVVRAYDYLKTLSYQLQHPPDNLLAWSAMHRSTVRFRIRQYLSGRYGLYINCQHTNTCQNGETDAIYLGAGRTRICYETMVDKGFTFCDLLGTAAHELGHAAYIRTTGDGENHNTDHPNDRVYRFGNYARGLCENELSKCQNYKLGKGPRVTITAPNEGEAASLNAWQKSSTGFNVDIPASAEVRGDYDTLSWQVIDVNGSHQQPFPGTTSQVLSVFGTCGCENQATFEATATDFDGNSVCDLVTFEWVLGCDPDGTSQCDPALCPAGCLY